MYFFKNTIHGNRSTRLMQYFVKRNCQKVSLTLHITLISMDDQKYGVDNVMSARANQKAKPFVSCRFLFITMMS